MTYTSERKRDRGAFSKVVEDSSLKIQIGARGQKIDPSWVSVDRYDDAPIIDANWDLHCLPIADESVDCYVCNAVIEHVPDPQLCLYEMFRTLRLGGQIWIEVPFMQFYHAHPNDFFRWTVPGLQLLAADFSKVRSGKTALATPEAKKILDYTSRRMHKQVPSPVHSDVISWFTEYDKLEGQPRCYSGTYYWGEKKNDMPHEKHAYLAWCRSEYVARHYAELTYDPDQLLSVEAVREQIVRAGYQR